MRAMSTKRVDRQPVWVKKLGRGALVSGLLALLFFMALTPVSAAERWVATWATAPQTASFGFPAPKAGAPKAPAPEAPAQPPVQPTPPPATKAAPAFFGLPGPLRNQTVRQTLRTSVAGKSLRVKFSNAYGTTPLTIGAARVALQDKGAAIVPGSDHALTFGGKPGFVIPPGALAISDPVDMKIPALTALAISVYLPGEVATPTVHLIGLHTTYVSQPGDFTQAATIDNPATTLQAWYFITGVDVLAADKAATIVAFGDSITDGTTSTPDKDQSWPSHFAARLAANKKTAHIGIVNQGISGNQVLTDGAGVSALARFDRDVLAQSGVKWVVLLEGINDIGIASMMSRMGGGGAPLTADDLIGAYKQLIERAHLHGIAVIGATLLPYGGASYYSENGEQIRQTVNQWIRSGDAFDAVMDFDAAVRNPEKPNEINPAYNINDHLHPNDAGYKRMADTLDIRIFEK